MIEVKNLYKSFDGKKMILAGVSYHVKKGEKLVIVGPSGGGKSTFLRCINTRSQNLFVPITGGRMEILCENFIYGHFLAFSCLPLAVFPLQRSKETLPKKSYTKFYRNLRFQTASFTEAVWILYGH